MLTRPPVVRTVLFGTDVVDGEPCVTREQRSGRCYELSALALLGAAPRGSRIVHGSIYNESHSKNGRIDHAWLLLPGGRVWEPLFGDVYEPDDWKAWADPQIHAVYGWLNAVKRMNKTGHYGPWRKTWSSE